MHRGNNANVQGRPASTHHFGFPRFASGIEGSSTSTSASSALPPAAGDAPSTGTSPRDNNAKVYRGSAVAAGYGRETLLTRVEAVALLKYQPAFTGKDVLDVGVGAGRTTPYLAPLARHYQAVDYSPAMVARVRTAFPGVSVALADMTDLHGLGDAGFDFVFASNNVLDAVGHEDRLRTLRGIHRILRHDGVLMFSSHNRDVRHAMQWPRLAVSRNPVTQMRHLFYWGVSLVNHARLRKAQTVRADHAIINDSAHDWSMLHYYIGPDQQARQLADEGFRLIEIFDQMGTPVAAGDHAAHSRSLLYVAQRVTIE